MITGRSERVRSSRQSARPSSPGSMRSSTTRSIRRSANALRISLPSPAVTTRKPCFARNPARRSRISRSSSTTSSCGFLSMTRNLLLPTEPCQPIAWRSVAARRPATVRQENPGARQPSGQNGIGARHLLLIVGFARQCDRCNQERRHMDSFERGLGSVAIEVPGEIRTDRGRVPDRDLASRYDAAAPHWHRRMRWLGYPEAYARLFTRLQAAARLRSLAAGGRVLDCGIGTGVLSLALAHITPVQEVVGVDIAPAMLREAAANLAAAGIRADLRRADAHRLPQPDASFDAVVSAHMLEHLARPDEAIGEMVRVLRPGAVLVIVATRSTLADHLIRLKWHHVPISQDQLITSMRSRGLRDIEVRSVGRKLSPAHWLSRAFVGRKA